MYENEDFDPYEAAQDYYEKFQRGTLSRRGGNFDWIATSNRRLQIIFIEELERLFGPKYKIRRVDDSFSVEELKTQNNPTTNQVIEYDDDER